MKLTYHKKQPGQHYIYIHINDEYLFAEMDRWIIENITNETMSQRHGARVYIFKFVSADDAMLFKLRWA